MSVPCPTPMKSAYATKQRALQNAARRSPEVELRAYKCPCRSWHLTRDLIERPKRPPA